MEEAGLEARFVSGFRVTTPEAIGIVEKTLSGTINPGLVTMITDYGGKAQGIPGTDVLIGRKIHATNDAGEPVDIGRVGEAIDCRLDSVQAAISSETVPVISTKLVYLSDVPGVLADPAQPDSLIPSINRPEAAELIENGTISGGMLPKINSALDSLDHGVGKVHFIDARTPHSLLLEIFTRSGVGTEIVS